MKTEINLEFLLKILALTADISYTDIWWRTDGDFAPVSIFINCNNVFDSGLADCEAITPDNLHVFEESVRDIRAITDQGDEYIPMLFCARVRRTRPIESAYPEIEALWPLFNACGPYILYPEREAVPPFKPRAEDIGQTVTWWEKFLAFIKNIMEKIAAGILSAVDFVVRKF